VCSSDLGTKFRDEIRPRFGVMRAREFYMKDAYSFHVDDASLDRTYQDVFAAYQRVFTRCGLKFRPVEAQTGAIGGSSSHEFMVLADTGEETIASCSACAYAANVELAEGRSPLPPETAREEVLPAEDVETPGVSSVQDVAKFMNAPARKFLKTQFYVADGKPVVALVRGDMELNEPKLQRVLGAKQLYRATDEIYRTTAGCDVGFAGPQGVTVPLIVDPTAAAVVNGISGANRKDAHRKNLNAGRDYTPTQVADIRTVQPGDGCPRCGKALEFHKGIEVGHVFKLGTKYSTAMEATFLNEKGQRTVFTMGCYGIGVSRIVASAIEQCHDENGIRWPEALAPYDVALLPLNVSEPAVMAAAEKIEADLAAKGLSVLFDDRDQRAGVKFKDADLLGLPWRVTVGEKKLALGQVEIKNRITGESWDVALDQTVAFLTSKRTLT
jgi:prolyl-tRNA synthetase